MPQIRTRRTMAVALAMAIVLVSVELPTLAGDDGAVRGRVFAEDGVTRLEAADILADRLNDSRCVCSRDRVAGPAQPASHQAKDVRNARDHVPDVRMHGGRVYPEEHLVVLRLGLRDFRVSQVIW